MIESIQSQGMLFRDSTVAGERRAADVFPAHPNGIPLSRDRWLVLYETRGFQGIDEDRSIIAQLRENAPDGKLIREVPLALARDDWDAFGDGRLFRKEHGHPVAFGVPRGALIGSKPAPHGNVFAVKWRVDARQILENGRLGPHLPGTLGVEWMQIRLNSAGNDLEILQPVRPLRQAGFSEGPAFCAAPEFSWMNQTFVQPVPFNADASEWADVNHFDGGRIAALKYRFNPRLGLYEWVETGPRAGGEGLGLGEASLARAADSWIVAARSHEGKGEVQWFRTEDPFRSLPPPVAGDLAPQSPLCLYRCPDGKLRLLTGNPALSPHRNARDPLYCFEIDVDAGFRSREARVVFDSVATGLPIRVESVPRVDFGKLLPHMGGRFQHVLHRVRTKSINYPANTKAVINAEEKACSGIYHAKVTWSEDQPAAWTFA